MVTAALDDHPIAPISSETDVRAAVHESLRQRQRTMQGVTDELDEIAGHLNAQHGRLIELTTWLLAHRDEWAGDGVWRPEQYLAWRCGVAIPTAKKIVALAERADELPDTVAAVRAGELSLDQATPIAKHAPAWADTKVASLARMLTVAQIQRIASRYPFDDEPPADTHAETDAATSATDTAPQPADDPDDTNANANADANARPPEPEDRCWYGHSDDGRWRLFVHTTADAGSIIEAALSEARDRLFRDGDSDVADLDALLDVAHRSLDAIESTSRRDRFRSNIHLHTDGHASDHRGRPLPSCIAKHVTCDGSISPVFVAQGQPVGVGRSQRIVPERTRRIVEHRDGGCRVPGCASDRYVEIHHIIHWLEHGETETHNLICLCPRHHRLHHRGRLHISGNADDPNGVTFAMADGTPIRASGASPRPPSGPPPPISGTWHNPIGERLDTKYVDFHPPRTLNRLGPPG